MQPLLEQAAGVGDSGKRRTSTGSSQETAAARKSPGFQPSRVESAGLPGGGVLSTVVPGDVEGVDLAGEMVGMLMAKTAFAANAKMLSTTFQTERRTLDLLT